MQPEALQIKPRMTRGSKATPLNAGGWRLQIPPGPSRYRLAQLDDYNRCPRQNFPHRAPACLQLKARASSQEIPGTWGFGFWNDPASVSFGFGGASRHLPTLPDAAWFFFASRENYLSLTDHLPGHGSLMAVFHSTRPPILPIVYSSFLLPFLLLPPVARGFRKFARQMVKEDSCNLELDLTEWHTYEINWQRNGVNFSIDSQFMWETSLAPCTPLGLVLWIDNQYAALPPDGHLRIGTLSNPEPAWIEIEDLVCFAA